MTYQHSFELKVIKTALQHAKTHLHDQVTSCAVNEWHVSRKLIQICICEAILDCDGEEKHEQILLERRESCLLQPSHPIHGAPWCAVCRLPA